MLAPVIVLGLMGVAPPADEWLVVSFRTADSYSAKAHDRRSGLLVTSQSGLGSHDPGRAHGAVRESRAVVGGFVGGDAGYKWECLELADPQQQVRGLRRDLGSDPPAGTMTGARLSAYSPPAECRIEYECLVVADRDSFNLSATLCTPEQRARLDVYLEDTARRSSSGVSSEEDRLGPAKRVTVEDLDWLRPGRSAGDVAAKLGHPVEMWPNWPDGFAWVYQTGLESAPEVVLRFGREWSLRERTLLLADRWQ